MLMTVQLFSGPATADSLDGIATLRLEIFREFPYLYDGLREDELRYLQLYAEAPDAFVITVSDFGQIVGAVTAAPPCHEDEGLTGSLATTNYPIDEIFYLGELLFYPAYRNCGLGLRLMGLAEEHVRSLGRYRYLTCATVVRPDNHHLRPADYVPIDRFLARTGFGHLPGIGTSFTWAETDGVKREHPMRFWIKAL